MSEKKAAEYLERIKKRLDTLRRLDSPLDSPRMTYEIRCAEQAFNSGNYNDCTKYCQAAESLITDFTRRTEDLLKETIDEALKIKRR